MKVTTCLNPLHTALATYGCVLGYTLIADEMKDEQLNKLVHEIGPVEGMPVVTDPGILSPAEFVDRDYQHSCSESFIPDTPGGPQILLRKLESCGETIKSCAWKGPGDAN